ncbi:MAG: hypothetical protein Q9217_002381 [Psora testacea]
MFFQHLDLTTALRPSLLPDETLLFVQDAIGLYEGTYKIPHLQNGHAYLTTHRVCYVDNIDPRKSSGAVELKNVERYDFYAQAGFLKSSPKVTLYPKPTKKSLFQTHPGTSHLRVSRSPARTSTGTSIIHSSSPHHTATITASSPKPKNATWVCTICSFSNPVPATFDPAIASSNTPLPPCLACGIKPPFAHVLKAAIAGAAGRQATVAPARPPAQAPAQPLLESHHQYNGDFVVGRSSRSSNKSVPIGSGYQCPRCTFLNHPSLLTCELCGASLVVNEPFIGNGIATQPERPESPGPTLNGAPANLGNEPECIRFSFRAGGEKIFYERLKGAMVQRKWLLQTAPPIPESVSQAHGLEDASSSLSPHPPTERAKSAGIAGLERRGFDIRKKNEAIIGSAFEDLDALMASAKEIIALAESFAKESSNGSSDANQIIAESAKALDMVTTKDMLGSSTGSEGLYLAELSRNLAEYLTDDAKNILKKEGGIMSLVDLWAVFNRARGGVELVSPSDFEKAARLWEKLKLPVRLRQFKNGLLVVQQADRTDDKTIAQLLAWLQELRLSIPVDEKVPWDWKAFGRGVTAQEAGKRFGWSVGVASEELEMAEEKGALCREEGVEGLRFWENRLVDFNEGNPAEDGIVFEGRRDMPDDAMDYVVRNLKSTGLL